MNRVVGQEGRRRVEWLGKVVEIATAVEAGMPMCWNARTVDEIEGRLEVRWMLAEMPQVGTR